MQYTNVPKPIRASVRALKYARKSGLRLFGAHYPRNCTICGHSGRFFSYGFPLAADTMCPGCLSVERHRALAICANQEPLFEGKDLLHFAPEPSLTAFIRSKGVKSYKTCDLFKPDVDLRIDVCAIDLPDQSFDVCLMPSRFGARCRRSKGDVGAEADFASVWHGDHHGADGGRNSTRPTRIRRSCPQRTD